MILTKTGISVFAVPKAQPKKIAPETVDNE